MKKIYAIGIAFLSLFSFSCSEWMDIRPSTEVEADLMFTNEDGFKSALTGVYARMIGENLYGNQLTFGLLEELAQRYDAGARYSTLTSNNRTLFYQYSSEVEIGNIGATKTRLSNIWNAMYTDIVNLNSLLEHLEENGREVIQTEGLFDIIKGEALGLRAFHYFDLLRMWGPADMANNGSQPTVPFRTRVGREQIAPMSADSLVIVIEADLLQADSLLRNDPCNWDIHANDIEFLNYRQFRMNRWAVRALMARFYLYANQPDLARQYAKDVIEHSGRNLVTNMSSDHAMFDESLFGLYYANMQDDYQSYFVTPIDNSSQTQRLITEGNLQFTYQTTSIGSNDIRGRSGQGFVRDNGVAMSRKYLCIENDSYDLRIPLIRLSEMYYIMAEVTTGSESASYYNAVRNARGISTTYNVSSFDDEARKIEALRLEYCKDFFGEGQYFFFLKRHRIEDLTVYFGGINNSFAMLERYYEFEIPDAEREYGYVPDVN